MDSAQQEAIHHLFGPMLLIAGPGSGKTRVITNRIRYLIEEKHILPEHILVVTFTNAAASQMRQRSIQLSRAASGVYFGTFHSVFFQILKQTDQFKRYSILDTNETYRLLASFCRIHGEDPLKDNLVFSLLGLMSYCKNNDIAYENLSEEGNDSIWQRMISASMDTEKKENYIKIICAYQKECMELQKLDFDDMILFCKQILRDNEAVRQRWTHRFPFIMIDEFQDINRMQYEVIMLLAGSEKNVFVVGDDDQSIYGFRGASPDFMRCFERDFTACKKQFLSVNYRSCHNIVKAAAKLIANNHNRFDKQIVARQEQAGTAIVRSFDNIKDEISWMVSLIKGQTEQREYLAASSTGYESSKTIAVLCRTNREAAYYEKALAEQIKIPRTDRREKTKLQYDREVVSDILAMLHMSKGDMDRKYFFRFMNKPERGFHRVMIDDPVSFADLSEAYRNDPVVSQTICEMKRNLAFIGQMDPYGAITLACNVLAYDSYLMTLEEEKKNRAYKTIEWLKRVAYSYDDMACFLHDMEQDMDRIMQRYETNDEKTFCENKDMEGETDKGSKIKEKNGTAEGSKIKENNEAAEGSKIKENNGTAEGGKIKENNGTDKGSKIKENNRTGKIEFLTYHASKGLEFDTVFLPGVNEGSVPLGRTSSLGLLEEERRMFYVAMTRAKENLYISYIEDAQAKDCVSVFIQELMK